MSRICLHLGPRYEAVSPLNELATEVISHLSNILVESPLFVATTWPTVIEGAETDDSMQRAWTKERFGQLHSREPWGVIGSAMSLLEKIWQKQSTNLCETTTKANPSVRTYDDWLGMVSEDGNDWLIL